MSIFRKEDGRHSTHTHETHSAAPRIEPNGHDKVIHTYEAHFAAPRIKPNGHDKISSEDCRCISPCFCPYASYN
ncbi:unnamed protein product [Urochloa humidicola]